jgi:hypothetical protein
LRARWHWLIPAAVIAGLLCPIVLTDRTFASDWGNHLWLIWVQGLSIEQLGEPTYFLQSTLGAFYPYYAFYGGTMYALLGVVSWLSSPTMAILIGYGLALSAAYLSWTWIARQLGVTGWVAQLPGCIAVTAPLAVTNLYGRGAIPETIATSAIPLVAASALSLFREPRVRLRDASLLVIGVVALTGTHALTLVWGLAFLSICAAVLVAANWRLARQRVRRGLTVAGLAFLGVCVNAWILVPLVLYRDRLAESEPDSLIHTAFTQPGRLFSPLRDAGTPYPITGDINAQLPVLALFWALACGAIFWRFVPTASRRVALGLLAVLGAFLVLVLSPGLIEDLPEAFTYVQFPYRLLTYVDLALVGLLTIALAAVQRAGSSARVPVLLLAAIAVFNFGLSMDQNARVRSWLPSRENAQLSSVQPPRRWYAELQYADSSEPIVKPTLARPLWIPVTRERRRSYAVAYPSGPAGTVRTNIVTGSYMVDVSGGQPVGRTPKSEMVIALPASKRPRQVEVETARDPALVAAGWVSIFALAGAAVGAAAFAATRRPA